MCCEAGTSLAIQVDAFMATLGWFVPLLWGEKILIPLDVAAGAPALNGVVLRYFIDPFTKLHCPFG